MEELTEEEKACAELLYEHRHKGTGEYLSFMDYLSDLKIDVKLQGELAQQVHDGYINDLFDELWKEARTEIWKMIEKTTCLLEEEFIESTYTDLQTVLVVAFVFKAKAYKLIQEGKTAYGDTLQILDEYIEVVRHNKEN